MYCITTTAVAVAATAVLCIRDQPMQRFAINVPTMFPIMVKKMSRAKGRRKAP